MKLAICLTLICVITVPLSAQRIHDDRFQLKDVFELEYASDPQISPDARQVVYVRNSMDIMTDQRQSSLWSVRVDGSHHQAWTKGPHDSQPRWSPSGDRLIYTSKADGKTQILCRWIKSGRVGKLTNLTEAPSDLAWSPDGKTIAFVMLVRKTPKPFITMPAKPKGATWADPIKEVRRVEYRRDGSGYPPLGFKQIFVIPADGGTPRQLTTGDFPLSGPLSWTPDGKEILFTGKRFADWQFATRNTNIYSVGLGGREVRELTDRFGPDQNPVVSPNGKLIAWLGYDDKKLGYQITRLYVMNRDGSGKRLLTKDFNRDVAGPRWSEDGRRIVFQYDDRGTTRIGAVDVRGNLTRELASHVGGTTIGRPYSSGSFSLSKNRIAFTMTLPEFPADVAVTSAKQKTLRLTRLNADLFGKKRLGKTREFTFKSSFDKRQIHGWIVTPPGYTKTKKYPLILEIHGGPFANYGDRFSAEVQLYASAGYVVVYVNPRGSTSYGEPFGNLIHHAYPGRDYDDLMSAVDEVIRRGIADPKRLYVTGGSGGGVLTSWIVGKTSRFRAAVAAKPVVNWYSFALTSDAYPFFFDYWFGAYPWEQPMAYHKRSPISLVGNVTTPTMLMTGEADHRTPISESEQFYQALKLRKIDTMLVRIPGASHAIVKRPSRLAAKVAYIVKWFKTHP